MKMKTAAAFLTVVRNPVPTMNPVLSMLLQMHVLELGRRLKASLAPLRYVPSKQLDQV